MLRRLLAALLAFASCSAPLTPVAAQVAYITHPIGASTVLSIGVRWTNTRQLLRGLSPYRNVKRLDGTYALPNYSLLTSVHDEQHLRWMGVGDWTGPRILTQAVWLPAGVAAAATGRVVGLSANQSMTLTGVGLMTYQLSRALTIPEYHLDPLNYAAGGAWAALGAYTTAHALSDHRYNWRVYAGLTSVWMVAYPWSTPLVGVP